MTTRRQWHLSALSAVVSAALLVACGGGGSDEQLKVGKVVSFGDSLSDLGSYTPATSIAGTGTAPFFAGRATTNTHTGYTAASNTNTATMWVEWVAAKVGVPITPAEVGFAGRSVKCPAAASPALADSCTGYAMTGSLITDPIGLRHEQGTLTVPLVTQVANHLARFGSFASDDIVFVWAGDNELFVQEALLAQGVPRATLVANMQTAGNELAALVKNEIVGKGARRVVVMTAVDLNVTPYFIGQSEPVKALFKELVDAFNSTVATGLAGVNVRFFDSTATFMQIAGSAAQYGFVNTTTPACDPAKIAAVTRGNITDGFALFCNASPAAAFTAAGLPNLNTLKTGASATTWMFADVVHPTSGTHKVLGDIMITNLKNYGWIPPNL